MKRDKGEEKVFKKLRDVEREFLPNLERRRKEMALQEPTESAKETADKFKHTLCEKFGLNC